MTSQNCGCRPRPPVAVYFRSSACFSRSITSAGADVKSLSTLFTSSADTGSRMEPCGALQYVVPRSTEFVESYLAKSRERFMDPLMRRPFLAGKVPQAPQWMQDAGLEWLFRLVSEPKRLWRRYVYLNPAYLFLIFLQALRLSRFAPEGQSPDKELLYG